jgi:hypothetical protein
MSRSSNQSTSAGVVCFFTAFTDELLCNCDLLSGPARRHLEASGVPVENRYFPMQTHYIFYMLAWMCLHSFSDEFSLVLSLMGLMVNVYTCLRLGLISILQQGRIWPWTTWTQCEVCRNSGNGRPTCCLQTGVYHLLSLLISWEGHDHMPYLCNFAASYGKCVLQSVICHLVPLLSLTFLQKSFKCAFVV